MKEQINTRSGQPFMIFLKAVFSSFSIIVNEIKIYKNIRYPKLRIFAGGRRPTLRRLT